MCGSQTLSKSRWGRSLDVRDECLQYVPFVRGPLHKGSLNVMAAALPFDDMGPNLPVRAMDCLVASERVTKEDGARIK